MPSLNGVNAAKEIFLVSPRTRTILLTMHTEDQYVLPALHAGIKGYVLKTKAAEDLVPWHPTLGDVDSRQALADYQSAKREHKAEWQKAQARA